MKNTCDISIVCPVYSCAGSLTALTMRLLHTLTSIAANFEIIYVNDACPQGSWEIVEQLAHEDTHIKGINLSRNFGQHDAITAGLDHAKGEWVVVMDCDLQDQPEEIAKLYQKAQEGYDIVLAQRFERKDSLWAKWGSKAFYAVLRYFTDIEHDAMVANFGIYSAKVIQSVSLYREQNRSFPLFINHVGFKKTSIPVVHDARNQGQSSYSFKKKMKLALDCIIAYSNKPLRMSIQFGVATSFLSVFFAVCLIIKNFVFQVPVPGWTSIMVSFFFMFGVLLTMIGILGLYIGKIFDEVKARPLYLVRDMINFSEE